MGIEESIAKLTEAITSEFNQEIAKLEGEERNAVCSEDYSTAIEARARRGQMCFMATQTVGILDQFLIDLRKHKAAQPSDAEVKE